MKLIFLNRFFYPDHSATSQMLSDLAFGLSERGQTVLIVTSRQRYDAPADSLPSRETVGEVSIYRVWTSRFGRSNLVGRALDYATFYFSAFWRLWRLTRSGDVVIAKTDPPMLSVVTVPICWLRRARLINWLQDIFPEAAQALGLGGRAAQAPYALMRWLRNKSLKVAHMNVVLGERMAECVSELGVPGERICIVPNWADGRAIVPIDHAGNSLRAQWDVGDAFVVAYSGNLGRAHEIETLLEAMTIGEGAGTKSGETASHRQVLWLFIGGGALFASLKAEVARRSLNSVRFKPYQTRAQLALSLSAADVHLVSLRSELEGLIVPSKFYGIIAAGRPTIFVGDNDGEIARQITRFRCGCVVAQGDGSGLASAINALSNDAQECREMGARARRAFEAEFDKPTAINKWQVLLNDIGSQNARTLKRDGMQARPDS